MPLEMRRKQFSHERKISAHHPSQPEAGLAGGAEGDVGGGHVRRSGQGLDLPGGLAGRTGAHYVDLTHTESDICKQSETSLKFNF